MKSKSSYVVKISISSFAHMKGRLQLLPSFYEHTSKLLWLRNNNENANNASSSNFRGSIRLQLR